jgi:hypothetical protein
VVEESFSELGQGWETPSEVLLGGLFWIDVAFEWRDLVYLQPLKSIQIWWAKM